MYHFVNVMQAINDNTTGLRNEMTKAGVPDFTVGMNVNLEGNVNARGDIRGQEVFNTANIDRSNAVQVVNKEIDQVRNDYNPAKDVYYGGMLLSYSLALSDGPQPGPGDAAGIIYGTSTIITAGIVWTGYSIYQMAAEHVKGKRNSTKGVHEKGQTRKAKDYGGEKGDENRNPPRQKPPSWKGPWPPRY